MPRYQTIIIITIIIIYKNNICLEAFTFWSLDFVDFCVFCESAQNDDFSYQRVDVSKHGLITT